MLMPCIQSCFCICVVLFNDSKQQILMFNRAKWKVSNRKHRWEFIVKETILKILTSENIQQYSSSSGIHIFIINLYQQLKRWLRIILPVINGTRWTNVCCRIFFSRTTHTRKLSFFFLNFFSFQSARSIFLFFSILTFYIIFCREFVD